MSRSTTVLMHFSFWLSLFFSNTFTGDVHAANSWSRAKGAVHSLHNTSVALRRRIDDVEPHGYSHRIACELEAAVCGLKEAIGCDAPRPRIELGMHEIVQLNQQLIRCVASNCDLRNDRKVQSELDRFQDRFCTLERELRKCISRIPVCPTGHPDFQNPRIPIGYAPLDSYPAVRGPSSLHPTFRELIEREHARRDDPNLARARRL